MKYLIVLLILLSSCSPKAEQLTPEPEKFDYEIMNFAGGYKMYDVNELIESKPGLVVFVNAKTGEIIELNNCPVRIREVNHDKK